MSYLIVASCDSDGKITGENRAGTEAEAEATRLIMVSEGYSKAFYVEMPDGNNKYFVADLDEKTVTYNASAYNGAVAALALAKFNQERSNLFAPNLLVVVEVANDSRTYTSDISSKKCWESD